MLKPWTASAALQKPGAYIPTLDGWRAIAVLMVVLSHSVATDGKHWYQEYGQFGVQLFFGISGFLICSRLLDERAKTGAISLTNFYCRRTFRLFPASWAYLAALIVFAAHGTVHIEWGELLSCVLFYRNYLFFSSPMSDTSGASWFTAHFWSLAVEEHFYLIFPLMLVSFRPSRATMLIPGFAVALCVCRFVIGRVHSVPLLFPFQQPYWSEWHLPTLLWGCWFALLLKRFPTAQLWRWLPVVGLGSFLFLLCTWTAHLPGYGYYSQLLMPVAIVSTVLWSDKGCITVLESAPFRWVGRMSYSLYLWQQLFFVGSSSRQVPHLKVLQEWPYNCVALFVCAAASYYLIERPLMRFGQWLARSRSKERPAEAEQAVGSFLIPQTRVKTMEPRTGSRYNTSSSLTSVD